LFTAIAFVQFPTGVFGTLACIGQLQLGWEASRITASPAAASVPKVKVRPPNDGKRVYGEIDLLSYYVDRSRRLRRQSV
jgi:hypothetical protein